MKPWCSAGQVTLGLEKPRLLLRWEAELLQLRGLQQRSRVPWGRPLRRGRRPHRKLSISAEWLALLGCWRKKASEGWQQAARPSFAFPFGFLIQFPAHMFSSTP